MGYVVKVFEIFRDEGLPEKKLSNEERVELLNSKIKALEHQRETIKQNMSKTLVPMMKTGRAFTEHNKERYQDQSAPNVRVTGFYIQYYEPIEGQWGTLFVKDVPENQSLIKWLNNQGAKLHQIGHRNARRKGEGGKLSELQRRVRALERAQTRRYGPRGYR